MKRLIRRPPTAATVISCVALFLSLGGVSWGVATGYIDSREIKDATVRSKDVRDNSLRTQDIRNNEIRGRDIRNSTIISRDVGLNSLTGSDILESELGPVPRADQADQADLLDGIDSTGFVRTDPAGFATIPFGASGSAASGEPRPEFDVDPLGYVHLEGVVASDGGSEPLLTLPVGARPRAVRHLAVYIDDGVAADSTPISIQPNGDVMAEGSLGDGDEVSVDGVSFAAGG